MKTRRHLWPGWYLATAWAIPAFGCAPREAVPTPPVTTVAFRKEAGPVLHRETTDEVGERFATSNL